MKHALVTGSAGFVGAHVVNELQDRDWEVTCCDLRTGTDCRDLFAESTERYSLIVHAAAVVGGRLTISNDPMAVAVDLELDTAMFRWAVRTHQPRVVYFSSSAAYPRSLQEEPGRQLTEEDLDFLSASVGMPDMTYGWAKVTGELLAQYARAEGIQVHVLRPFSGYGPGQDDSYPFPAYVQRALRHDDPFEIWGDGSQTRDFVHIDDILGAMFAMVYDDYPGPLNIGTGVATSFNELAAMVCQRVGYSPTWRHLLDKPVGPTHRVADATLLHDLRPPKIELSYGLDEMIHMLR